MSNDTASSTATSSTNASSTDARSTADVPQELLERATDAQLERIATGEDPWKVLSERVDEAALAADAKRQQADGHFIVGLLILSLGATITAVSYATAAPGGTYVIATGALMGGLLKIGQGLSDRKPDRKPIVES